jgi:hypothetical protein
MALFNTYMNVKTLVVLLKILYFCNKLIGIHCLALNELVNDELRSRLIWRFFVRPVNIFCRSLVGKSSRQDLKIKPDQILFYM